MERVVIDTNVYIDWLNEGQHEAVLFQRDVVKYLSAVVLIELSAGAFSVRDRRLVQEVNSAFAKVDRILVPTVTIYEDAGDVLRRLQEYRGYTVASTHGLVNDVLIARPFYWSDCNHSKRARFRRNSNHPAVQIGVGTSCLDVIGVRPAY